MGALSLLRAARRFKGLTNQQELPHLEALLERECGQPGDDYRMASIIAPIIIGGAGLTLSIVFTAVFHSWLWMLLLPGAAIVAGATWAIFDYLHRQIGTTKAKIRTLCEKLTHRYSGLSNIVGMNPALAASVGIVLDEAAGIYMKHCSDSPKQEGLYSEAQGKAVKALEEAMAKMLELSTPEQAAAQELELERGWARPLLAEMQELDAALGQHAKALERSGSSDALAGLREARSELQRIDTAIDELEEHQRS